MRVLRFIICLNTTTTNQLLKLYDILLNTIILINRIFLANYQIFRKVTAAKIDKSIYLLSILVALSVITDRCDHSMPIIEYNRTKINVPKSNTFSGTQNQDTFQVLTFASEVSPLTQFCSWFLSSAVLSYQATCSPGPKPMADFSGLYLLSCNLL
jgi:hypothetical protein